MRSLDTRLTARVLAGVVLVLAGSSALGACGSERTGAQPGDGGATAASQTQLTIEVKASRKAAPKRFTLTCGDHGQAGGSHPRPVRACAALEKAKHPFAPVPRTMVCTEIFGGDQTATVRGTWHGEQVDASYSRENGCQIDRWDTIGAVFPVKVGI